MAKPIDMTFEVWTWLGLRNHLLDGVPDLLREWAILRGKSGWPRMCPAVGWLVVGV